MTAAERFVEKMSEYVRRFYEDDMAGYLGHVNVLNMLADAEFVDLASGISEKTDHSAAMAELAGLVAAYYEVKDDYSKLNGGDADG